MEFTYNASALGAGGVIERLGKRTLIPSIASVALSPAGGEGSNVVTNYSSEELSFLRAETRVAGYSVGPNIFTTYTDVYITGLRIFDSFSVALLHATVTSTRDATAPSDDNDFTLHASYRGVEVNGVEVAPVLDVDLCKCTRYDDFDNLLKKKAAIAGVAPTPLEKRFGADTPAKQKLLQQLVRDRKVVQGSVVEKVERGEKLSRSGHKVFVPGLGTVRLGELMLKPGRRRLNLLRVSIGKDETIVFEAAPRTRRRALESDETGSSGLTGSVVVASLEGNGTPIDP
jgi:hypothetical protein